MSSTININVSLLTYAKRLLNKQYTSITTYHNVYKLTSLSLSSHHSIYNINVTTYPSTHQRSNHSAAAAVTRSIQQQSTENESTTETRIHHHESWHDQSPRPNIVVNDDTDVTNQSPILQQANHLTNAATTAAAIQQPPPAPSQAQTQTQSSTASNIKSTSPTATKRMQRTRISPITLTPSAAERIKYLLNTQNEKHNNNSTASTIGIRIGVRSRGCSGLSYTINYVTTDSIKKLDDLVEQYGLKIYIDPKSLFYIIGTTMDWVDTELASEFVFNNPKAKSTCGCGESFNV